MTERCDFVVGDEVVCVDASPGWYAPQVPHPFVKGQRYVVSEVTVDELLAGGSAVSVRIVGFPLKVSYKRFRKLPKTDIGFAHEILRKAGGGVDRQAIRERIKELREKAEFEASSVWC